MSRYLRSGEKVLVYCLVRLCLSVAAEPPAVAAVCARTPDAAIDSVRLNRSLSVDDVDQGFRVAAVRWDPVLQERWAVIASCEHPERPTFSLQMDDSNAGSTSSRQAVQTHAENSQILPPVVRAGDIVRLWSQEEYLRIEVTAVSEQNGGLGKNVRVRLLRPNSAEAHAEQQFVGVVRGPNDVEMQR
jgi:Chaperone for flagella basal body P-ring formation